MPDESHPSSAGESALSGGRISLRGLLPFVGPAVVASIAYMDPGNFATNIQAGARHGYMLLWVVLLANVIAMLFQALSARLGIVAGQSLAALRRRQGRRDRGSDKRKVRNRAPAKVSA